MQARPALRACWGLHSPRGSPNSCLCMQRMRHSVICAGVLPAESEWLAGTMHGVTSLCAAYVPLAVELFCQGVLGALVRIAQRWAWAQPHGRPDGIVALFKDGLVHVVTAFGVAVTQARAHGFPHGQQPKQSATRCCRCAGQRGATRRAGR